VGVANVGAGLTRERVRGEESREMLQELTLAQYVCTCRESVRLPFTEARVYCLEV
jgi:hypothetical protein